MWLYPVFQYIKDNKWAQIALLVLAVVFTVGVYLAFRDEGVRKRARAALEVEIARKKAQERDRIIATRQKQKQEIADDSRRADEAVAASPRVAGPSELRKRSSAAAAGELLGPASGGSR